MADSNHDIDPQKELAKKSLLRRDSIILVSVLALVGIGYAALDLASDRRAGMPAGHTGMADLTEMTLNQLVRQGNQLMDAGRYEPAVMHYTLALQRDPSLVDVRVDRGACYYALEQYDKAISDFEEGIEREPDHAIAHFNMGITYHSIGEDSLMVEYWRRFLELSPEGDLSERVRDAIEEFIGTSEDDT